MNDIWKTSKCSKACNVFPDDPWYLLWGKLTHSSGHSRKGLSEFYKTWMKYFQTHTLGQLVKHVNFASRISVVFVTIGVLLNTLLWTVSCCVKSKAKTREKWMFIYLRLEWMLFMNECCYEMFLWMNVIYERMNNFMHESSNVWYFYWVGTTFLFKKKRDSMIFMNALQTDRPTDQPIKEMLGQLWKLGIMKSHVSLWLIKVIMSVNIMSDSDEEILSQKLFIQETFSKHLFRNQRQFLVFFTSIHSTNSIAVVHETLKTLQIKQARPLVSSKLFCQRSFKGKNLRFQWSIGYRGNFFPFEGSTICTRGHSCRAPKLRKMLSRVSSYC